MKKNLLAMQETQDPRVQSLGLEDALEEGMADTVSNLSVIFQRQQAERKKNAFLQRSHIV